MLGKFLLILALFLGIIDNGKNYAIFVWPLAPEKTCVRGNLNGKTVGTSGGHGSGLGCADAAI
jgi:hypothetical protein